MNVACQDALHFLHRALHGLVAQKNPFAEIIKDLSFGGEAEVLFAPLDEQRLEMPLQRTDRLADGGLGNPVDRSSLGEAFGFSQVAKHFEAFNLHNDIEEKDRLIVNKRPLMLWACWKLALPRASMRPCCGLYAFAQADAELDNIIASLRSHPKVLEVRWQIYANLEKWAGALEAPS